MQEIQSSPLPIASAFQLGEEGCWNELNTLQRLLDHIRPRPKWRNEIANIVQNINQALVSQFITTPDLALEVRIEAGKLVVAAAGAFASSGIVESTQDPVPGRTASTQDPMPGRTASTQDPVPVHTVFTQYLRFGFGADDDVCGNGRLWWLLHHHFPLPPNPPDPWVFDIECVVHEINEALLASFIADPQLAAEVRTKAGKNVMKAAEKFVSDIKTAKFSAPSSSTKGKFEAA